MARSCGSADPGLESSLTDPSARRFCLRPAQQFLGSFKMLDLRLSDTPGISCWVVGQLDEHHEFVPAFPAKRISPRLIDIFTAVVA